MSNQNALENGLEVVAYADPWLQVDRVFLAPEWFLANPESDVIGLYPVGG